MAKLTIDFNNFSGGFASHPLADNECAEMLDCMVRRDGVLVGTMPFQEANDDIGGTFIAFHNSESGTFGMATNGIYKLDTTSNTWTSLQSIAVNATHLGSIAQFDNWILFGHYDLTALWIYNVDTGVMKEAIKTNRRPWSQAEIQAEAEISLKQWWDGKYPGKPYPGYDLANTYYANAMNVWGDDNYINPFAAMLRLELKTETITFAPDLVACDGNYCYATNDNIIYYTSMPGFYGETTGWDENIYLIPESDDRIIDMKVMFGRLYIFKKSGITVKSGGDESSFSLEKVSNEPCCSRVAVSSQGIYFLGPDCLMRFDGSKSVKVSAKLDPSILTASLCEARVFYSSRTNTVYVPAADGYLYCYDEIMDRWHRRSYPDVICMHEALYEAGGKTNECAIGYTGNYRCRISKSWDYMYAEVGGAADPNFTLPAVVDGGTDGTVDLTHADVDTISELKTFIDGLGYYYFNLLNATGTELSTSLSDIDWIGCTDKEYVFKGVGGGGGSFMRMSLLSSGRVLEEDTSGVIGVAGKIITKKLDFGSPELYKRPYRLYFNGTANDVALYNTNNTVYEISHIPPTRINYYSPSGSVAHDYTLTIQGIISITSMKFVVDGIAI